MKRVSLLVLCLAITTLVARLATATTIKQWNGSTYSIPGAGDRNWAPLSEFLEDLADNAQTTNRQRAAIRTATATPVTVSAASDYTVITNLSVAGPVAVNLPVGVTGQSFVIVDGKGDASSNNITITPNSGLINGAATYVISRDRGAVVVSYAGTGWSVVAALAAQAGQIVDADVASGAEISLSKLDPTTASRALVSDGGGLISPSSVTATELGRLSGVSSAIQTQLNAKQPLNDLLTGITGVGGTGVLVKIDGTSAAARTITAGSGLLTITNGDGVAGNPSIDANPGSFNLGDLAGDVSLASQVTGTLPIGNGGTGQTSANAALNALLPSQTSESGKVLTTNGTNTSWGSVLTNPMDSAGDMIVGGSGGTAAKLDNGSSAQVLLGQGAASPTWNTMSGDVTIGSTGTTAISSGVIVNGDVNASAAIDGTKIVSATASVPGVVTTGAQTFAGTKSFSGNDPLLIIADTNTGATTDTPMGKLTFSSADPTNAGVGLSIDAYSSSSTGGTTRMDVRISSSGSTTTAMRLANSELNIGPDGTARGLNFGSGVSGMILRAVNPGASSGDAGCTAINSVCFTCSTTGGASTVCSSTSGTARRCLCFGDEL